MFVGTLAGAVSALGNSLAKRRVNGGGVIDSQGVLFSFMIPAIIGMIFSSILAAIDTQSPGGTGVSGLLPFDRS
mgnify:CR=1 FL=1